MPFGAVAARYVWGRISSAVVQILSRLFHIPVLRYVGDLFLVVPAHLADSTYRITHSVVAALGLVLASDKSPRPSASEVVLGVSITLCAHHIELRVAADKLLFWQ